jgi:hypothetical protein
VTSPDIIRQKWVEFLLCLDITLKFEGVPGKVDDPDDPGGRTAYGVTQKVYTAFLKPKPSKDVWGISIEEVQAIYHRDYWLRVGAAFRPWPMPLLLFDAAVNHGVSRAIRFLADSKGDPRKYLDCRVAFYHAIVRHRPVSRKYLKGWLRRADTLRAKCFPDVPSLDALATLARAA